MSRILWPIGRSAGTAVLSSLPVVTTSCSQDHLCFRLGVIWDFLARDAASRPRFGPHTLWHPAHRAQGETRHQSATGGRREGSDGWTFSAWSSVGSLRAASLERSNTSGTSQSGKPFMSVLAAAFTSTFSQGTATGSASTSGAWTFPQLNNNTAFNKQYDALFRTTRIAAPSASHSSRSSESSSMNASFKTFFVISIISAIG